MKLKAFKHREIIFEHSFVLNEKEYDNILATINREIQMEPPFDQIKQIGLHLGHKDKDFTGKVVTLKVVRGKKTNIPK